MKQKKLNIALIGYGKMGHIIERIAKERGHNVTCIIDRDNTEDFNTVAFREADVAIEFSTPATAVNNILQCVNAGVPVVCGTTGWQAEYQAVCTAVTAHNASMLFGSNFSIGVNIFMALNRYLADVMNSFPQYCAELTETHHIHKLDHPSGTAVTLADELTERVERIRQWGEPCAVKITPAEMPVNFIRRGEVPGIHTITWDSDVDTISLTHSAKSREGFALGAVMAAEWLPGHKGVFSVSDMLSDFTGLNIFK